MIAPIELPSPNVLDRVIGWLSPQAGLRRQWARVRMEAARAFYDGATIGRRGASIRRAIADPNLVTQRDLPRLRYGSRDLFRNNAHVKRAGEAIVSNTVGTGIMPQFSRGGAQAEDLSELARRHLHTTACDAGGRHTLGGLQALAFGACVESGEVLVRRRWRRPSDGFAVPVQFQVLEADYLDEQKDGPAAGGGRIVQGVEFDGDGRTRGYWMFREHPGSNRLNLRSDFVPARDILHLYRMDRPGQVRGIPWVAPVLLRIADYADLMDAHIMRQKIAACFAAFVEDPMDGQPNPTKDGDDLIDRLEPGTIERLPPGTSVNFASPPGVEGGDAFAGLVLREVAAGWGISYEAMTSDLRGVNFSSGKMGRLEFQRNIDRWAKQLVIPDLCDPLVTWFLEACELISVDTEGVTVRHIPPRREMIDPTREVPAERNEIRSGRKTWSEAILERGRDPEEFYKEYAEDLKRFDRMGIVVDADARIRTNAGLGVKDGGGGGEGGEEDAVALSTAMQDLVDLLQSRNGA